MRKRRLDPTHEIDEACKQANRDATKKHFDSNPTTSAKHNFMTRTYQQALMELSRLHEGEFIALVTEIRREAAKKFVEDGKGDIIPDYIREHADG